MSTPNGSLDSITSIPVDQQHQINIESTASHNQPSQSPPLNLPRLDLLNGRREDFNLICVPLYNASTTGDLEAAKDILDKRRELVQFSIIESHETILHIAVLSKSYKFVEYLMTLMTKEDLKLSNRNGETAFYLVARVGDVKMARILVKKNSDLVNITNSQGMMPLYVAALFGRFYMVKYLYDSSHKMSGDFWTFQNQSRVFEACVDNCLHGVALQMVTDHPKLAINKSVLRILAERPNAFLVLRPNFMGRVILFVLAVCHLTIEYSEDRDKTFELLRVILIEIMKLPKAETDDIIKGPPDQPKEDSKQTYSSGLLFLAAEKGNHQFVAEVIRQYPYLALEVNDNNQSIFHVAVEHRHEGVFKLLHEKKYIRDLIVTLEDKNRNNILHLLGDTVRNTHGLGPHLNRELHWYYIVAMAIPRSLRVKRNNAGLTPAQIFNNTHKDSYFKEEKWIKEVATQLMVVAALVATISFAALFTFPGGYDQDTGIPIFFGKTLSKIFIIFDSLSFISSTTSILMVLFILGSNYGAYDLTSSLPIQLKVCLASVFFSITTIILTFLINLSLLYQTNSDWRPTLISASTVIPFLIFLCIRYRFLDLIKSFRLRWKSC